MVQLKVFNHRITQENFTVSIPYGTIKSYAPELNKIYMKFQFLMVQLKE
ncbi:MAG: hypothetical protein ACRC6R_00125 [Bacteroidales bacterium]